MYALSWTKLSELTIFFQNILRDWREFFFFLFCRNVLRKTDLFCTFYSHTLDSSSSSTHWQLYFSCYCNQNNRVQELNMSFERLHREREKESSWLLFVKKLKKKHRHWSLSNRRYKMYFWFIGECLFQRTSCISEQWLTDFVASRNARTRDI